MSCKHIMILTQYRKQLQIIEDKLNNTDFVEEGEVMIRVDVSQSKTNSIVADTTANSVEILTIDKCQGRDQNVVILSFVRNNPSGKVLSYTQDN